MAERPAIVVEVRIVTLESGEVLVATRPEIPGVAWSVEQAFEED